MVGECSGDRQPCEPMTSSTRKNAQQLTRKLPGVLLVLPWPVGDLEGGVTQVVVNLLRQSRGADRSPSMLGICSWQDKSARYVDEATGRTVYFRLWFPGNWRGMLSYLRGLPAQLRALLAVLRTNKISVVNQHYVGLAALNFVVLRWLRLWRGNIVLSFHGSDLIAAGNTSGILRILWDALVASADRVVAPSSELATQLRNRWPRTTGKLTVVPNGVDAAALRAEADSDTAPYLFRLPEKYILSVGGLERKKGHDILLRSFKTVLLRHPEYQLLIVGRAVGFENELRNLAGDLGIEKYVQIVEGVPHQRIGRLFRNATIFVVPSRYEPFGIVALEAGVFGVPVIASAVGGLPEVIRDRVDGILVQPEDPSALTSEICALVADPALQEKLANAFRRRVEESFSWENTRRLYEEVYQSSS